MIRTLQRIAIGLGFLCITCVVAGCTGLGMPSAAKSTPIVAGCLPTATGTQSSQSGNIVGGATFGGPLCAFAQRYGDQYFSNFVTDGIKLNTNFDQGVDGAPHVSRLDVIPMERTTTWTQQQAQQICLPFLPSDAIHQRDSRDQYGDVLQYYASAHLAATFPASSSAYSPTGTVIVTYAVNAYGVFECQFEDHAA